MHPGHLRRQRVQEFSTAGADGNACDDGDGCTTGDTCFDGTCEGADKDCDDFESCTTDGCTGGACTHTPLGDGATCDDGDLCSKTDMCQAGVCVGTNPVACAPGGTCFDNSCDPLSGTCVRRTR
ncbi:MAG: hypothetical protein H6744_13620 [Deltaproteobacteria bacterium]|nr:hypothetical protein [Deltaproteobacteria bacterium]